MGFYLIARRWVRPRLNDDPDVKFLSVGWCMVLVLAGPIVAHFEDFLSSEYLWVVCLYLCFITVCLFDSIVSLWRSNALVRKPLCQLNIFIVFYQQQNLGRRFRGSKMHLRPLPVAQAAVRCNGGGSVVVDLLFYVPPIVCGGSVLVFVWYALL